MFHTINVRRYRGEWCMGHPLASNGCWFSSREQMIECLKELIGCLEGEFKGLQEGQEFDFVYNGGSK